MKNNKTVLVIDDEEALLDIISISLESYGFKVITASNGLEGIHKAKTEKPGLLLLDIVIPDLSGWEILEILESNPETFGIPTIITSAISPDADLSGMLKNDIIYYQKKPFNFEQLLGKVMIVSERYKNCDEDKIRNYLNSERKKYFSGLNI